MVPAGPQHILVVGPGWLGAPLASSLADDGARVWTLQRHIRDDASPIDTRITALAGDIRTASRDAHVMQSLPSHLDHLVVCIAPNMSSGDGYEDTYPIAARGALQLAAARACRSLLYTGSTGVYGRTDGSVCAETDDITPRDDRQDALRRAELHLMDRQVAPGTGRTILRVAGLYGPGRDPAARFRSMSTGGDVWCNMAWRDDVMDAMRQRLSDPPPAGETAIYNCADGTPLRASTIARALGTASTAAATTGGVQGAGRSNQRISSRALQATGWTPRMRTALHGLAALGHAVDVNAVREEPV